MTLHSPRHFHGQASEPVYTPPGFSVAAPLPKIKIRKRGPSLATVIGCAFAALLTAYAATTIYAAWRAHQAACSLPETPFTNCED